MQEIIIKPIITEKVTNSTEKLNQYGFVVNKKANKIQIKGAIESLYGVQVERVNTMIAGGGLGKVKYTNKGVIVEKNKLSKKAIVTLKEGEVIDFYGNL
ncbi:MAG: 50S ribosomal protein L23 [Flavobacteriales bacterium]